MGFTFGLLGGIGGGSGGLYNLGPTPNAFATAAARDTYSTNEANAAWLRQYVANRRLATIQGAAGDAGPYYAIDSATITDRLWIVAGGAIHAYDADTGGRDTPGDIALTGVTYRNIWSAASNATRIYFLIDNPSGGNANSQIIAFAHDGTRQASEDITLGQAPSLGEWNGIAATDTRIYALWADQNNQNAGVRVFNTAGAQQNSENHSLPGFTSARDIEVTSTRFRVLSTNATGAILSYDTNWAYQSSETVTLPAGQTWTGISEHGGELFVLSSSGIRVYSIPTSGAPSDSGRRIAAGGSGIAGRYSATATWIQVLGTGVAGATGAQGLPGNDASVTSANVTTAIQNANPTQDTTMRTSIGAITEAQADTRVQAGVEDWAEEGNTDNIPAGKLSNAPGLTQSQVDARVQAGVEDWAEEGNTDAIPAAKLTNAPSGTGGLTQSQVDARVQAGVEDWAEEGNTDPIPAGKLTNAPSSTGGLTQSQVDARVQAGVKDFAETGNTARATAADLPSDTIYTNTQRFTPTLETKLNGIEANAKDDQTADEIIALFRNDGDTNASQTARGIAQFATAAQVTAANATDVMLAPADVDGMLTGISIAGQVLTFTRRGESDVTITIPGGSVPVPSHTRYAGISTDTTFVAADFTGGTSATANSIAIPTWASGNRYVAFAIPNTADDLTVIREDQSGAPNQFTAFQRVAGTIDINGTDYKVWRSNRAFLQSSSGDDFVIS